MFGPNKKFTEQELNTLATKARETMEKEIARELVDVSMRHKGGEFNLEANLVGMVAVILEGSSQDQLFALTPVLAIAGIAALDNMKDEE